jgi:hypothetical protein
MMRVLLRLAAIATAVLSLAAPAVASDHADPINNPLLFWKKTPLEAGITDLFVFPDSTNTQLIVILCVRPALTADPVNLDQYEYSVYMDLARTVSHSDPEFNARYGGRVDHPEQINPTHSLTFRLKDKGMLREPPVLTGFGKPGPVIQVWGGPVSKPQKEAGADQQMDTTKVNVWTGITDDPFIFPNFFGTNVVAMVTSIPLTLFGNQQDWIVWGVSRKGDEQIDHVGRSLRTQNPRFGLLNTLPPSKHVDAIKEERDNPSVMRDIFLVLGINGLFGYRAWDLVPDVMLFTRRNDDKIKFGEYETTEGGKPVIKENVANGMASFPNGRILTDDVADRLARYGDTLLKELSYVVPPCFNDPEKPPARDECTRSSWPRRTVNDKQFQAQFPYLSEPWNPAGKRAPAPTLHASTQMILALVAIGIVVLWFATAWLLAWHIDYKRQQRRYL